MEVHFQGGGEGLTKTLLCLDCEQLYFEGRGKGNKLSFARLGL